MLVEVGKFTFPADFVILEMEEDSKVPLILGRPFLHTADAVIQVKQKQLNLGVGTERMIFNIDSTMKHSYSNDDTCFSIVVIDEILEEDFDALLDEGSKILHSIKGTLLEEEIFAEFDEFMAMTANENSDSESDTEDPPFEKITINTDYKIKTSIEEPLTDLKLKPLPDNLEYVFLEEPFFLPIIISSQLSKEKKNRFISVLKKHKQAFTWKAIDIPGICPSFCKHKIKLLDDKKPVVQKQRRLNPNMQEVVKKEIMKLLDTGIIYPIIDSHWVSPIHCVPKKGGITVVTNENDELVPTRTITGWRVCIGYRKLNEATAKDHFHLPFMDQMLERLAGNKYFCFLDGFSGYFQIPIDPNDQEKTTFTCPFGTYAYRRMPFGLCNAPATFQRCMLAIFHDMIEESVEVFMDDFSVFGNSFDTCLNNLDKMLQRCKDAHLVLNWEKCHFMVKEGIVLGHKVSSAGLEVDKAKIDVISKLPPPTNIKVILLGQKNTLAEYMILFSADNRPPMLDNGPERECKLYDAFDKFTHIKGESLHKYYMRFTQLINDLNINNMKMEQFQVNTKFLNNLPPEWNKFVTDFKLVKDLHTTNFDQLHAYLEQHELYANEVCLLLKRNQDLLAFVANQQMTPPHFNTHQSSYKNPQFQQQFPPSQYGSISTQPMTESPLVDSSFVVPVFSPRDDPISFLNKAMAFLFLKTEDLDTYDSDCDDISNAKAVLMANISNYGFDVISEVPHFETYLNDMENQSVHGMQDFEQTPVVDVTDNEITSDSNIISYS
ncbi:reverse transcriptase domain-containing protein [Tanacetum coccineum]